MAILNKSLDPRGDTSMEKTVPLAFSKIKLHIDNCATGALPMGLSITCNVILQELKPNAPIV